MHSLLHIKQLLGRTKVLPHRDRSAMPSQPAPPPAATARRRSRSKKPQTTTVHVSVFNLMPWPPPEQDWADLPLDALSCVLHKLDTVELLIGGVAGVCRSWRRAAREEPSLWRRIDLRGQSVPPFRWRVSFDIMLRDALRLSAGRCEAFVVFLFGCSSVPNLFGSKSNPALTYSGFISC